MDGSTNGQRASVAVDELAQRARAVLSCVHRLERAWRVGTLAQELREPGLLELAGERIYRVYSGLLELGLPQTDAFRDSLVRVVIGDVRRSLYEPARWFTGRAEPHPTPDNPKHPLRPRWSAKVQISEDSEIPIRLDQILAAREWRLGMSFGVPEFEDRLTTHLFNRVIDRLAVGLRSVATIERQLLKRANGPLAPIEMGDRGHAFERLIIDVLNEEAVLARPAPFFEDFLEQTDLRVKHPDIKRSHGARVQVTLTIGQRFEEKAARLQRPSELVVLSPETLAQAVTGPDGLTPPGFWAAIPGRPTTVAELAFAIKALLLAALRRPLGHPLGPLSAVPPPLRALIRGFVAREALRSTEALRAREATRGRRRTMSLAPLGAPPELGNNEAESP